MTTQHRVATPDEFRSARVELLAKEKEVTRLRDDLSQQRRELPWVRVDRNYRFESSTGTKTLAELFAGRGQLMIYHFMFGPEWTEGCPSCSFWMDSFDGVIVHLNHRDVTMVAVSRAPLAVLEAYRKRMGWQFEWVSSLESDFNFDFGVSFTPEQQAGAAEHNYRPAEHPLEELPGLSVFAKDDDGVVYHTYSCYSRGLDPLNSGYQLLDLVPKGRDEAGLSWSMDWLRRHDAYD